MLFFGLLALIVVTAAIVAIVSKPNGICTTERYKSDDYLNADNSPGQQFSFDSNGQPTSYDPRFWYVHMSEMPSGENNE